MTNPPERAGLYTREVGAGLWTLIRGGEDDKPRAVIASRGADMKVAQTLADEHSCPVFVIPD